MTRAAGPGLLSVSALALLDGCFFVKRAPHKALQRLDGGVLVLSLTIWPLTGACTV